MPDILVVEDDKSLQKSMQRGIEGLSPAYTIFAANNGLEAVKLLEKNCIRLMITDLIMPGMDGFELVNHVWANYPEVPVIITTGHSIPDAKRKILNKNSLDILFKPFPMKDLQAIVKQLIEKQANGGTLNNVSPAMFIQLIDMERKTCTVRVRDTINNKSGILFFRNGKLLDAKTSESQGKQASLEIFSWEPIRISIENDCARDKFNIKQTLNALLLEASRIKDEKGSSPQSVTSWKTTEPIIPKQKKSDLSHKLSTLPGLDGNIHSIETDTAWEEMISQIKQAGDLLNTGKLKAIGILTGANEDLVIVPGNPPTVIEMAVEYPKENIYNRLY
ncbi:MAG: response regulator [Desulfobacteraceae bacterium]|nr:response regulator [Desulfobacteraceae bacterium]